ncbi:hypothetical protein [Leptospira kanakyensis]|uniref:hypothetical protein n=1 Tax=Leptospira kanakyensis TaxID=2484968 RepID=UPI00223DA167|nr:hypothetical protein [Leptospira kanakyensis]MCW7469368.1 hypothetical protein [Leptospira kanakyensis]
MKKYSLEITEEEAIILFELFTRFGDTNRLSIQHPSEYITIQNLAAEVDKTTSAMFKEDYKEILTKAQKRISKGFEGIVPNDNVQVAWVYKTVSEYFWPEFIDRNGMIFIKSEYSKIDKLPKDPIEAECFINHLHILDLFNHSADLPDEPFWDTEHSDYKDAWNLGKHISEMWKQKLERDFPNDNFRIYLSKNDNPVLRFHKVRKNHINWFENENNSDQSEKEKNMIIIIE